MSIQWFPGHMHKARKEVEKTLDQVDLVIEVIDARIPFSSENPMIRSLRRDKPTIKVLTKSDLADPYWTERWLEFLEQQKNVKALPLSIENPKKYAQVEALIRKLLPAKDGGHQTINAMVMGIPNVGKSTLINTLAGKNIAKTGNEPAITKGQQKINLRNGIMLWDTPGMLWPKVENSHSGYRLAITGAIKDTAMSYDDIAFYAVEFLFKNYPQLLIERYKLERLPESEMHFFEMVGRQRGCLQGGGRVDFERISKIIINEFRSKEIGAITLETPDMVTLEMEQVERELALKAAKKAQRLQQRKSKLKRGK